MLADKKFIPTSRIAQAGNVSPEYSKKVMSELKEEGLINPEHTPSGRELISFNECRAIWERFDAK